MRKEKNVIEVKIKSDHISFFNACPLYTHKNANTPTGEMLLKGILSSCLPSQGYNFKHPNSETFNLGSA